MVRPAGVMAAVAVTALLGCGGSSAEDEVREVVRAYASAVANGDERAVCGTLSAESKKRFERAKTTCPKAYRNFGRFLRQEQKDALKDIDPTVKVQGDTATAAVREPPLEGDVRLSKEEGEWKITVR